MERGLIPYPEPDSRRAFGDEDGDLAYQSRSPVPIVPVPEPPPEPEISPWGGCFRWLDLCSVVSAEADSEAEERSSWTDEGEVDARL